jgi:hypothetical protein
MPENEIVDTEDPIPSVAVQQAVLPPQSIEESEEEIKRYKYQHGDLFKSSTDCEYFAMLPLPNDIKEKMLFDARQKRNEYLASLKLAIK